MGEGRGGGLELDCPGWKKIEKLSIEGGTIIRESRVKRKQK